MKKKRKRTLDDWMQLLDAKIIDLFFLLQFEDTWYFLASIFALAVFIPPFLLYLVIFIFNK